MGNTAEMFKELFDKETLARLFSAERSNEFFDALFGDASEGAYDIELAWRGATENELTMELRLNRRANCCLACNLTSGLPPVFARHPVINIAGLVQEIDALPGNTKKSVSWSLGETEQLNEALHIIPLHIMLA
jgi:hypothetical protein